MSILISVLMKRGDFEAVFRQGKPLFCGIIGMKILPNDSDSVRLGISVGLKFSRKAVDRNRLKRQIKEFFIQNKTRIARGFDGTIFINAKACQGKTRFESGEVSSALAMCLKQGRLIR